ncbi:unnamed protein product [Ectocarpus sp. 13 AM-2016]
MFSRREAFAVCSLTRRKEAIIACECPGLCGSLIQQRHLCCRAGGCLQLSLFWLGSVPFPTSIPDKQTRTPSVLTKTSHPFYKGSSRLVPKKKKGVVVRGWRFAEPNTESCIERKGL